MCIFELSIVDFVDMLLRVNNIYALKDFIQYTQVLQYIYAIWVLHYIEGLLVYVTFCCWQILGFPEFTNLPKFKNDCSMLLHRAMHIPMLFSCWSRTAYSYTTKVYVHKPPGRKVNIPYFKIN